MISSSILGLKGELQRALLSGGPATFWDGAETDPSGICDNRVNAEANFMRTYVGLCHGLNKVKKDSTKCSASARRMAHPLEKVRGSYRATS
jgi:hypothetical protein